MSNESDTTEGTSSSVDTDDISTSSVTATSDDDSSNGSEMDLKKDYKPIGQYLRNRREMTRQMFHAIRGSALKRIIPKSLRVSLHKFYLIHDLLYFDSILRAF